VPSAKRNNSLAPRGRAPVSFPYHATGCSPLLFPRLPTSPRGGAPSTPGGRRVQQGSARRCDAARRVGDTSLAARTSPAAGTRRAPSTGARSVLLARAHGIGVCDASPGVIGSPSRRESLREPGAGRAGPPSALLLAPAAGLSSTRSRAAGDCSSTISTILHPLLLDEFHGHGASPASNAVVATPSGVQDAASYDYFGQE